MAQEDRERLQQQFEAILASLLAKARASRSTLRIDLPQFGFQVDDPAAEARDGEVPTLTGQTGLDQRALDTVRWMEKTHDYLIQPFCEGATPAPPEALIRIYGVKAQMLGPVVRNGRLLGWISVHENRSTRDWTADEIAFLKAAVADVEVALDQAGV